MLSIEQIRCNDHRASGPFIVEKSNASSGLDLSVYFYSSSLLFLFYLGPGPFVLFVIFVKCRFVILFFLVLFVVSCLNIVWP